ncbi:DUF4013 domain-containing protein [Candidatus Contubernalis alkaliaceticus]|uniref:DUF4013 domain-containing protein n=1 Tax=Candidatus Contubernalis alkaliaceticus TaxID=338645 RepID=UPI001F4BF512|nr:DUF4013 domain-containing protein [Candidatus Contubernalis alkalaceticus]UNC91455.1 DUF4013 domain-containing protein [Candidatus Contubernalis alkalaceticus]
MAWQLQVIKGPDQGVKVGFSGSSIVIGREPSRCGLVLSDGDVSRHHARLTLYEGRAFQLEDMGSTNGTFVNKSRIKEAVLLNPNDSFRVGSSTITLLWTAEKTVPLSLAQVLKIPFAADRGYIKLLIGALFSAIPLAHFLVDGYRYRLMKDSATGMMELPEWDSWTELLVNGFLFWLVQLIYLFIPGFMSIWFFIRVVRQTSNVPGLPEAGLMLSLVLFLLCLFFLPMSWAHFAATGHFSSAFQISFIASRIKAVGARYAAVLLLLAAMWFMLAMLSLIPFVGIIILVVLGFYIRAVSSLLYGELYRISLDVSFEPAALN